MSEEPSEQDPQAITAASKSNLAFALLCLPKQRRDDMVSFYAFCRVVDDIADAPGIPADERRRQLQVWADGLRDGFKQPDPVQRELVRLREVHDIPNEWLLDILRGMEMDIEVAEARYQTFEDLQAYCYRVACVVGLVSVKIFGATDPASEEYAVNLGYALQWTNIMRDVGEDLEEGRVYLPQEDLKRFNVTEEDLRQRKGGENFTELMELQAERAEGFYAAASAGLPAADKRELRAAVRMGKIYHEILGKMRAGGYRVFDKRYRLSKLRKLAILLGL